MGSSEPSQIGKYDVLARIAQGGMAEIFLAKQPGIGGFSRRVVLKCILPILAEEPRFVQMFMEEARLASQIHHPNVVQIFDVGEDDETFFIAMEYIDGLSVGDMLLDKAGDPKSVPIDVAGEIVAQACSGLHAAHKLAGEDGTPLNLVHRDVSPQNLMVSRDGVVKLVDFGIAKAVDSSVTTRTGNIKGKYAYMSPEQVRGKPLDRRSDLFSLGAIFYELVTGKRLFHRNAELAILVAIIEDEFPSAHEANPDVPVEVSDIIQRALARERDQRFANAAQMGNAVRETLGMLGHYTSSDTLAAHIEGECGAVLSSRKVNQLDEGTPSSRESEVYMPLGGGVVDEPAADGPEHPTEPTPAGEGMPDIIDLPPPGPPATAATGSGQIEMEAPEEEGRWSDEPTVQSMKPLRGDVEQFAEKPFRGPLPEPAFDEDDVDFAEAPTALAPIPPEREASTQDINERPPSFVAGHSLHSAKTQVPFEEFEEEENKPPRLTEPTVDLKPQDAQRASEKNAAVESSSTPETGSSGQPQGASVASSSASGGSGWAEFAENQPVAEIQPVAEETSPSEVALPDIDDASFDGEDESPENPETSVLMSIEPPPAPPNPPSSHQGGGRGGQVSPPSAASVAEPKGGGRVKWLILGIVLLAAVAGGIYFALNRAGGRPSGPPLYYANPPSYRLETLQKNLRPLADYLEGELERPVEIRTTKNYEELQAKLLSGDIHFANLPPLLFLKAHEQNPNLKMLAIHAFEGSQTDQSYIIARDDSGIRSVKQLRGRRFCHPDPRSTTGYLMPRAFLRSQGLDPDELFSETVFSEGHVGVMEDIVAGRCDAGAVISSAWLNARALGVKSARIRLVTAAGDVTRDVVCASPELPEKMTKSLQEALLRFHALRDIGQESVSPIFNIDRFAKVQERQFEAIEKAAREEGLLGN